MTDTQIAAANDDGLQVLTFDVRGETFALEAGLVREILDLQAETEVPGAAPFVDAVMNFRGKVIPVADLRLAFGLGRADTTQDSRVVVIELEIDGDPTLVGLRADKVHEVASLPLRTVEPPPPIGMRWRQDFVSRIARRAGEPIILPDLGRIFAERGQPVAAASSLQPVS
jgi:purine-binding chemotaxis protein CheW